MLREFRGTLMRKEQQMEACLQARTRSLRFAEDYDPDGVWQFSDDKNLLMDLFPEPHMQELVNDLTYALSEVERFLSMM